MTPWQRFHRSDDYAFDTSLAKFKSRRFHHGRFLKDEYQRLCREPSDIYLHLPRFVQMVTERNAQHVIELGTRTGVSTVAWLYGLEQTGGRLTSVDLDPQPEIGSWPHWTFHQCNDLDGDLLGVLDEADIVFIDTSHHWAQTRAELNVYRWLVKPGGLLVCHDTELKYPEGAGRVPAYPVRTAVEEFCSSEGFEWVNHPECFGLAVITVR